jgi:long-chain acyl-CoA synthetase
MLLRIQALPEDEVERYDLSSIQALTVGGARAAVVEAVDRRALRPVLWEGYGTSESGMVSYMPPDHQLTKPGAVASPMTASRSRSSTTSGTGSLSARRARSR